LPDEEILDRAQELGRGIKSRRKMKRKASPPSKAFIGREKVEGGGKDIKGGEKGASGGVPLAQKAHLKQFYFQQE